MSIPSNHSSSTNPPSGKKIPPVTGSPVPPRTAPTAKAKPPVVVPAGGAPASLTTPALSATSGYVPASYPQSVPPVSRGSSGSGLIIGMVVGIPLLLMLVCGVGGYFVYSSIAEKVKTAQADRNNSFSAIDSPDVRKEVEQAFGKLDEELKKQEAAQNRAARKSKNSPPSSSFSPTAAFPSVTPRPGEPEEKDDFPTNIKRLQTGNDDAKRRAAEWFAREPLDAARQAEVSQALNALNTEGMRKHALGALKVWGTKENVPMICKIMQQEAFVKIDCLDLIEKFKDERAIEPLITMLNEAFREGECAEEMLADWWPQAEPLLVKHLHDKQHRIRERTQRILELRKTDQALLITQTLEDLQSSDREVRRSAVSWLAKLEVKQELQPQVAAAAQKLLADSNGDTRRNAVELFGKYAQKDHADELLKLLDERDHEKWRAGLTGLIRLGDVRAAERIGRRKEIRGEAFRIFREAGAPAEDIVAKTLTHVEVTDWGAGQELCEILGDIGTTKSVGFLQQVKKKALAAKTSFVGEAADKAIENIRRRNAG